MCTGGGASTGLKEKEKPFAKGIVDCVSLSDIYSKTFIPLILQIGNNALLELGINVLSCVDFTEFLHAQKWTETL